MKTDIHYAGSENLTKNKNLRIHSFIDVVHWKLKSDSGHNKKRLD